MSCYCCIGQRETIALLQLAPPRLQHTRKQTIIDWERKRNFITRNTHLKGHEIKHSNYCILQNSLLFEQSSNTNLVLVFQWGSTRLASQVRKPLFPNVFHISFNVRYWQKWWLVLPDINYIPPTNCCRFNDMGTKIFDETEKEKNPHELFNWSCC